VNPYLIAELHKLLPVGNEETSKQLKYFQRNILYITRLIQSVSNKYSKASTDLGLSFLGEERFDKHTQPIELTMGRVLQKFIDCGTSERASQDDAGLNKDDDRVQSELKEEDIAKLGVSLSDDPHSYHKGSEAFANELKKIIQRAPKTKYEHQTGFEIGDRVEATKNYSRRPWTWNRFVEKNRGEITDVELEADRKTVKTVTITWDPDEANPYYAHHKKQFVKVTRPKSNRFRLLTPKELSAEHVAAAA